MEESGGSVEVAGVSSGAERVTVAAPEPPRNQINTGQSSTIPLLSTLISTLTTAKAQPKSSSSGDFSDVNLEQLQQIFSLPMSSIPLSLPTADLTPPPTVVATATSQANSNNVIVAVPSNNEHNDQEQLPTPHQTPLPPPPPTGDDVAPVVNDSNTNSVENSVNVAPLPQSAPSSEGASQPAPPEPKPPQQPPPELSVNNNNMDSPQVSVPPLPLPAPPNPPTANSVLPPPPPPPPAAAASMPPPRPLPLPPPQAPVVPPGQSQGEQQAVIEDGVEESSAGGGTAMETTTEPSRRVSPPSLHANEEMLSEDSEEEEMDARDTPIVVNNPSSVACELASVSSTSLAPPTISSSGPTSVRSESASPYAECDDESFADFVAKEASTSMVGGDISHSPTPNPSHSSSQHSANSDIHALLNHLHQQSPGPSTEGASPGPSTALISQFGVTASCPPTAVQLPEGALPAPLDMTARNFPKRSKYAHRAAISAMHPYNRTRGGGPSVAKTLDLLKAVLQPSFNQELKRLCDDYMQIFTLAANNIRENTRDNVPEATLRVLVHKMMEEAQHGYVNGKWEFPTGKLPRNEKVVDAKCTPMASKKVKPERSDTKYGPPKRARKPPSERHSEKSSGWRWGMDKKRLDPVKWEPEKLTCEIDFVLGVNVNKALGHAANRGKVYYLHPELFKYACDGDDKTWLYENKHLPVHGGKAFLMIFAEVEDLIRKEDIYKDSNEVWLAVKKLQKFHVPQFMVDKMKYFMQSVQGYFAQEAKDGVASSSTKP